MCASKFIHKLVRVGCWNIECLFEKVNGTEICKLDDKTLQETIKNFDILCLQETHIIGNDTNLKKLKDFQAIIHSRNKSANNRYFGGFLIFIRNSIGKGLKIGKNQDKDIFELTSVVPSVWRLNFLKPIYKKGNIASAIKKVFTPLTKYKKTCRMAERDARRRLTNALLEIGKTDHKMFWNIIDKMNKWGKIKKKTHRIKFLPVRGKNTSKTF